MNTMKHFRHRRRGYSIFLLLIFSIYGIGCTAYRWNTKTTTEMVRLKGKPLVINMVDESQPKIRGWSLEADSMDQSQINGKILRLSPQGVGNLKKIAGDKSDRLSKYYVILSLEKEYAQTLPDYAQLSIPLGHVTKVEVYEFDENGAAVRTVFAAIGAGCALTVIALLIALATKQSCPFIYADNPGGMQVFEGEIYSGATAPQLERHDWLPMKQLQIKDQRYQVIISNRVKEIQNTNLLELLAIDHPDGMTVLFDKYGNLHTLRAIEPPWSARSLNGMDIKKQVEKEDSLQYLGEMQDSSKDASDGLILEFKRPPHAASAKLVLNAKNSLWLDHAYGLMLDQFGEYADKIREKSLQQTPEALRGRMLQQNIPLSVWLENAAGRWERVDYFNLAGPMAFKQDVLPLDLSKIKGDHIRVKLSYGYKFWEIDRVGMDFTADQPLSIQALPPLSAVDLNGLDHREELLADDQAYYTQPRVGEEARVLFPAPPLPGDLKRSLILHAKGHYQILREPKQGKPPIRALKQFKKPNAFPLFAREQWRAFNGQNTLAAAPDRR